MRGAPNDWGTAPKTPNNVTSTSFSTVHLLLNDIRFEHGGTKLAYCPGRRLASLRSLVWWVLQQIISLPYRVTSHRWVSILDRCYMKTWNSTLNSFTHLKLITSPNKYFLLLWNNVYEIFGTNYCISKRWPMGPLQLSSPPWLKPLVTPLLVCLGVGKIFSREGTSWFFEVFLWGSKSGEVCFLPLKTKKTAFFCWKYQNLAPFPTRPETSLGHQGRRRIF